MDQGRKSGFFRRSSPRDSARVPWSTPRSSRHSADGGTFPGSQSVPLRAGSAGGYTDRVKLPFDRELLDARNARDERDAAMAALALTPGERLRQALDLSDAARSLARSVGASWIAAPPSDLADKARRTPTMVLE